MVSLWTDVRVAARSLVRKPFFSIVACGTLAMGIGANTAIYSVVDSVLIDPLPFPESHRILSYNHEAPGMAVKVPLIPHSQAMYLHYREHARAVESFAVHSDENLSLITDGEPRQLTATQVTQEYFDVLGVQPFLGRAFMEGEDRPGAEPVTILAYPLWEEAFGEDPEVLDRMVEMDGVMRRIVGVMPRGFAYRDEDVWVPLEIETAHPDAGSLGLIGIARLAPGMDKETAQAEMQDLLVRFSEAHPDELGPAILAQTGLAADVKALKDIYVQDVRDALWILMGTVGFVLLIACANVANLFLVRAEARRREQAVRTAMGAGRADIVRQHLTESVTLAVAGGLLGLGLAAVGVRGLLSLAPADLPGLFEIGIDGSVLVFTGAVSVASGVLFGIFPAFGYGRRDLSDALKDGSRSSSTGKERNRVRKILAVGQVALALVLLVGSGLMLRSFVALRSVDPGFDSAGLATFRLALPGAEYGEPEQVLGFHRELSARLASAPGILGAGMVSGLPLAGSKSAGPMEPLDDPFPEGELGPIVERRSITPGYLETMAIPILDGRGLRWEDQAHQFRGIVISETLARTFWPDGSAVGRQIRNQGSDHPWEVVGVAGDVRFDEVADDPLPLAYFPVLSGIPEELQSARAMDVVVRVAGDPLTAIPTARDVLRSVSGRLPMIRPRTVESVVQDSMASTSFTVLLLGIAAGIALLLGTVGIYGVLSYLVSRRTQEIGVRMAVGAPAGAVRLSVVGEGMALAGMGLAVGLFGAWGLSRVLASLLYGVSTTDLATFGATTLLLALVALAATWVPALRASRVDPVEALKSE